MFALYRDFLKFGHPFSANNAVGISINGYIPSRRRRFRLLVSIKT